MGRRIIYSDDDLPLETVPPKLKGPVSQQLDQMLASSPKTDSSETRQHRNGYDIYGVRYTNNYIERVVKLIPAEVVALTAFVYRIVDSMLREDAHFKQIEWGVFSILLIATPVIYNKLTHLDGRRPAYKQIILSTGAFAVWMFYLGSPFETLSWYKPLYGLITISLSTLLLAIIE